MKYLLTDVGAELLAKLGVTGEGLHLIRAQAGEGYSDTPEEMTALINGQLDIQIADLERQKTITTLTLLITNHTLQEEHRIQQIGIFAQGGEDAEEVLFIIGQDQNGDVLPSADYGRVEYRYTVNLKISNAQNIILDVNDTDFVLKKTFNEQVGKVDVSKGNLQEQIDKVTVAVDEKIMKYLGAAEEGESLGFAEGLDAKNVVDAINKVFTSGSEKKEKLVENLTAVGIKASTDETLGSLIDKVLDMTDNLNQELENLRRSAIIFDSYANGFKVNASCSGSGRPANGSSNQVIDNSQLKLRFCQCIDISGSWWDLGNGGIKVNDHTLYSVVSGYANGRGFYTDVSTKTHVYDLGDDPPDTISISVWASGDGASGHDPGSVRTNGVVSFWR